ncbi:50S ribosomal protein L13 [Caldanaerobius polysaccharolyticus]|uniref:50S ribosomal protein L13 n=1 Tax=Caldanaerobius polysaccharolyticus TaxID=44256 RepID=UPI00047DB864|nr:50S ribosomal protein L13 [Caldanaerobius polysaccharolyticus]
MKTYLAKPGEIEKKWYVVDAKDKVLGRLASRIAIILMGKHKPVYTPNVDTGDYVIVVNADKIVLTGNKLKDKVYARHTGYPGGFKTTSYEVLMKKNPEKALYLAVKRMLPKNRLANKMIKKLKIYRGPEHTHQAQRPEPLDL